MRQKYSSKGAEIFKYVTTCVEFFVQQVFGCEYFDELSRITFIQKLLNFPIWFLRYLQELREKM